MRATTNPTTQAQRRYLFEMAIALAAYLAILFTTRYFFRAASGPWEWVVALLPVLPVIGILVAVLRWLAGTDEFNRRLIVDALAIAGGTTALLAATYGFLEGSPLPRPSAWWTWTVFMVTWLVVTLVMKRRYR